VIFNEVKKMEATNIRRMYNEQLANGTLYTSKLNYYVPVLISKTNEYKRVCLTHAKTYEERKGHVKLIFYYEKFVVKKALLNCKMSGAHQICSKCANSKNKSACSTPIAFYYME
jgi:hypothetical protein